MKKVFCGGQQLIMRGSGVGGGVKGGVAVVVGCVGVAEGKG